MESNKVLVGMCGACGGSYPLDVNGVIEHHGTNGLLDWAHPCNGWGTRPVTSCHICQRPQSRELKNGCLRWRWPEDESVLLDCYKTAYERVLRINELDESPRTPPPCVRSIHNIEE